MLALLTSDHRSHALPIVKGVASNGAGQLAGIDLDDAEWQAFGAGIARLARERERRPNDFDHFLQVSPRV